MPDDNSFALVLNLHQPAGNLERLLADNEWEAREILWALDRLPPAGTPCRAGVVGQADAGRAWEWPQVACGELARMGLRP